MHEKAATAGREELGAGVRCVPSWTRARSAIPKPHAQADKNAHAQADRNAHAHETKEKRRLALARLCPQPIGEPSSVYPMCGPAAGCFHGPVLDFDLKKQFVTLFLRLG